MGIGKVKVFVFAFIGVFFLRVFSELTGLRFTGAYGAISLDELPVIVPNIFWSSIFFAVFISWFFSLRKKDKGSSEEE